MEISDLIKSARIEKGLTQQQLADVVFVTRQTISKWELGKSVPDQASLVLLYQCLDINDNEKKQLSKLIFNKQNIILVLIAILFSPIVIGVRFICCKIDKIENRKIKERSGAGLDPLAAATEKYKAQLGHGGKQHG